ncbi:hypothetical protein ACHWQZ_G004378 [Mnemiopsis leidyi]
MTRLEIKEPLRIILVTATAALVILPLLFLQVLFMLDIRNSLHSPNHNQSASADNSLKHPGINVNLQQSIKRKEKTKNLEISNKATDPAFNLAPNPDKKIILLLSSFRSGSSFLGQLFDSNPNMQYLYEPFFDTALHKLYNRGLILGAREDHTVRDWRGLYLQQILHNCSVHPTAFSEMYEYCGSEEENVARFNTSKCVKKRYARFEDLYQEICRYRRVTVLKVIRLRDIADVLKIKQIRRADIKIVHLVRHPLPVTCSRRFGGRFFQWDMKRMLLPPKDVGEWRTNLAWEMYNYCTNNLRLINKVKQDAWLRDHYLLVKHRDASRYPLHTTEIIYNFVEETLPEKVKDHVRNITHGPLVARSEEKAIDIDKNSTEVLEKWRELRKFGKFDTLNVVEGQCGMLMRELGEDPSFDELHAGKHLGLLGDLGSNRRSRAGA